MQSKNKLIKLLIIVILFFNVENIFTNEKSKNNIASPKIDSLKTKIKFGFILPYPTAIEFSINNFDIGVGVTIFSVSEFFPKSPIILLFKTYFDYIFLNLRIKNSNFIFFLGSGLFFEIGKITNPNLTNVFSGITYKIGVGLPLGIAYEAYYDFIELIIKTTPSIFIGQLPNGNLIFPIKGNFSIGIKCSLKI
ncbi:BAPKO_0422 family outer member beta-barrel protein [Borreliella lusitaniae]|uniref:BAPKO_0422 family outer member beta-barrel protein n=1 Tax=Borreliella lusitaniae TaxID=100177 RepID=UPI003C74F13E